MGPSVCPTLRILKPSFSLRRFPKALDDSRVGGTGRLVGCIPMHLLTLLGLYTKARAGGKKVWRWRLRIPSIWETDAVEGQPKVMWSGCEKERLWIAGETELTCNSRTA